MKGSGQTLYLKIEQNCIVYKRTVRLEDIAKIECTDIGMRRQVKQMELYRFTGSDKKEFVQVFSVLRVIQLIHEKYPEAEISNIGAPDFVIRYEPDPEKKGRSVSEGGCFVRYFVFRSRIYDYDFY